MTGHDLEPAFLRRFEALAAIGRDPATGGLNRLAWTRADAEAGAWFDGEAARLGLAAEVDRNGNRWAWWWPAGTRAASDRPDGTAVAVGSHLDSVPDGGSYDGALGVVTAFTAVESLQAAGFAPSRPLAVTAWADEEGARFGTPCFGSGLSTGTLALTDVAERRDEDGIRLADAIADWGIDPAAMGVDPERLDELAAFVELHIEQGRGLVHDGGPVGIGTGIAPHGRWRYELRGQTNHAGTTALADRRDPMLVAATLVDAARAEAERHGGVATVGRVTAHPGATNAVPGQVHAWLDARAPDAATLEALVSAVAQRVDGAATEAGVACRAVQESAAAPVTFDPALRERIEAVLTAEGWRAPPLLTAAGHDAGALASRLPTAMLYVRNRSGISHSPAEHADDADCLAGVRALAAVLRDLLA